MCGTDTLTENADFGGASSPAEDLSLTSGDDTITGSDGTLNAGDIIADSGGNDTLTYNASTDPGAATVIGIEDAQFNFSSFGDRTVDAANFANTTLTFNNTQTGGSTTATVSNMGSTVTVNAGNQVNTVDINTIAAGGGTINGQGAGAINVGDLDTTPTTITSTNAGTTAAPTDVNIEGAGNPTDAANLSAVGVVGLDTAGDGNNSDQVSVLDLSGNGAAVTYDITNGSPEQITASGDQDVTIQIDGDEITTETVTNSLTAGTLTLALNAATGGVDLTNAEADVFSLVADLGQDLTFATGDQTVLISADQASATAAPTSTTGTDAITIRTGDETGGDDTITLTNYNFSGYDSATVDVSGDAFETATGIDFGTGTVTLTGSGNATFAGVPTADAITADSGYTGNLSVDLDPGTGGAVNDVTGSQGNDTFTVIAAATAGDLTLDGGPGGTDQVDFVDAIDLTGSTVSLSNIDLVRLDTASATVGETVDLDSTDVSGQSFTLVSADGTDTLNVAANEQTIDLSGVSVDTGSADVSIDISGVSVPGATVQGSTGADTLTGAGNGVVTANGNAGADSLTGGSDNDDLDGGAGADFINGAGGDDDIVAGAGADNLFGAAGADTIDVGSGDNFIQVNTPTDGSGQANAGSTFSGFDQYNNFDADGGDQLVFDGGTADEANLGDGASVNGDTLANGKDVIASDNAATDSNDLAADGSDRDDVDSVVSFLGDAQNYSPTSNETDVIGVTFADSGDTAVYIHANGADSSVDAGDVSLLGVIDTTQNVDTADFTI